MILVRRMALRANCYVFMWAGFMQPNEVNPGEYGLAVLDSMGAGLPLPIILMCKYLPGTCRV